MAPRSPLLMLALALPVGAAAQSKALVLKDLDAWGHQAIEAELDLIAVPYDVVGSAGIATVDPYAYTMIFVSSCQPDALYQQWNANLPTFDAWVDDGGFLSIHGCNQACGLATGAVFPNPPGTRPTPVGEFPTSAVNLAQSHPLLVDLPAVLAGNAIAHTSFTSTGEPSDTVLLSAGAVAGGNPILFERVWGNGRVLVAGLTYEYGWFQGEDAGAILQEAVAWGATFALCDHRVDSDYDGVGDDCDDCPGFDDGADLDLDQVPDACDPCPLASPDDADADGVCDDVDDSDGDGWSDLEDLCLGFDDGLDSDGDLVADGCDSCPGVSNPGQADGDGDGIGDPCDACPIGRNDDDDDGDGVATACDACPGHDDHLDLDADGLADGCDNCPALANPYQADHDRDDQGDACDVCPAGPNDRDADADGVANACDACDGFADSDDLDGDGVPDACDVCVATADAHQIDEDEDGYGRACDCDDRDLYANPYGVEVCDGIDNDCDGVADGSDALDAETWYQDADGDGQGVADATLLACDPPLGWAGNTDDCDDASQHVRTNAPEVCDGLDNDCDGGVDDGCGDAAEDLPRPEVPVGCATAPMAGGSWLLALLLSVGSRRRRGAGDR